MKKKQIEQLARGLLTAYNVDRAKEGLKEEVFETLTERNRKSILAMAAWVYDITH